MTNYSTIVAEHVNDLGGGAGTSFTTTTSTFLTVASGETLNITHGADNTDSRMIYVNTLVTGTLGITNTTLDFDLADEADFIQEDSVSGTDFSSGTVTLHNITGGSGYGVDAIFDSGNMNGGTLSESDSRFTGAGAAVYYIARTKPAITSGKWYWEIKLLVASSGVHGLIKATHTIPVPGGAGAQENNSNFVNVYINGEMLSPTRQSWTAAFAVNDAIGFAFDADNGTLQFYKNGVATGSLFTGITTGITWHPYSCVTFSNSSKLLVTSSEMVGSVPNGYTALGDSGAFSTDQAYYITTSDSNQIPLSTINKINSCTFDTTLAAGNSINALVSFDDRNTWKTTTAGSFSSHSGLSTKTGWSTLSGISTAFTNLTISGSGYTSLDFAFLLGTSVSGSTPALSQVTLNYDENGYYKSNSASFLIKNISSTSTRVIKTTAGTEASVKVITKI